MQKKTHIRGVVGASHIALEFRDISEPYFFFTERLGLKPKFGFSFENQRIAILGAGGIDIELIESANANDDFSSMHIAFKVKDIEKAVDEAKDAGCRVVQDVYEPTKGIKEAIIEGPCGLLIQFVEEHVFTLICGTLRGELENLRDFPTR